VSVTLRAGGLEATYLTELGMVCSSLLHEGDELLALRGGPEAYAERGSSFGIPLLYPWANRLSGWDYEAGGRRVELDRSSPLIHVDGGTGLPIHGLLTASRLWTVAERSPTGLAASLDFGAHAELLALFPFPHRVEMQVGIADSRLTVRTVVIATGDVPVPISFGFHPYLRCDRQDATIELPVRRRAVLDDRGLPTGSHETVAPGSLDGPLGERAFDDSFAELSPEPVFSVADGRRTISIEMMREAGDGRSHGAGDGRSHGAGEGRSGGAGEGGAWAVAQVYSPAGAEFICFEPMTAPVDALRSGDGLRWVQPGDAFEAEFAVSIRSR
jgi:aldose 1-epimerase